MCSTRLDRRRSAIIIVWLMAACSDAPSGDGWGFGDGADGSYDGSGSDDGGTGGDDGDGGNGDSGGGGDSNDDGDSGTTDGGGSGGDTSDGGGDPGTTDDGETTGGGATGVPLIPPPSCEPEDFDDGQECDAPYNHEVCDGGDDPFHAIGLGCAGDSTNSIPIANESFNAPDPLSWAVAKQFGTHVDGTGAPTWGPTEGETFLFVTTGQIDPPDADGVIQMPPQEAQNGARMDNSNVDMVQELPSPIEPAKGSNEGWGGYPFECCDGVGDCSDTLHDQWTIGEGSVYDLLWFQFDLTVPVGTHGYEFDFAWFSAEYPEYVAPEVYNDVFVVWSTSDTYTGNITFINDQPLTVTALQEAVHDSGLFGSAPELAGTGFDGMDGFECAPQNPYGETDCPTGGSTGWFVAQGSAAPGETFQLTWAIFDMGDPVLDTAAIIDNFRWDCEGCNPAIEDCGVHPQ